MTIAELYGKLSTSHSASISERLEDLLTSDVFSTMKYAGWNKGFVDWLLKAQPAPILPPSPSIKQYFSSNQISKVDYSFWPKLKNKREPDVALLLRFDNSMPLLILIEAKYFSGTSDWEESSESSPYGLTGNQIADQVQGLSDMSEEDLLKWFRLSKSGKRSILTGKLLRIHLFITIHNIMPKDDYQFASVHLGDSWPINAYWLSWNSLADCLKPNIRKEKTGLNCLIKDLCLLLYRKKLVPFRGFEMKPWHSNQEYSSFWHSIWWNLEPFILNDYKTFWTDNYFNTISYEPMVKGSFWERV